MSFILIIPISLATETDLYYDAHNDSVIDPALWDATLQGGSDYFEDTVKLVCGSDYHVVTATYCWNLDNLSSISDYWEFDLKVWDYGGSGARTTIYLTDQITDIQIFINRNSPGTIYEGLIQLLFLDNNSVNVKEPRYNTWTNYDLSSISEQNIKIKALKQSGLEEFSGVWLYSSKYRSFSVSAKDSVTGDNVSGLTLTFENGSTHSTQDDMLKTGIPFLSGGVVNFTLSAAGYENVSVFNYDILNNRSLYDINMTPHYIINVNTSGYYNNGSHNFVRVLEYDFNYTCWLNVSENTSIELWVNGSKQDNFSLICNGNNFVYAGNFSHNKEGALSFAFYLNTTDNPASNNKFFGNQTLLWDLYAPNVVINFTVPNSFLDLTTNITMYCNDSYSPILNYNLSFNGASLYNNNLSSNSTISINSATKDGANVAVGVCSDFLSETEETYAATIWAKTIYLIDEKNNVAFDYDNLSSVRVYFDDNSSYFDFKSNNTAAVNFTSSTLTKLRFELIYGDDSVITRYVDVSLLNSTIRVCANKEGVTHYEQLIISSLQREAVLKNVFSNCVVAADYTRFAYQDAYSLKAYTSESLYYVYTFDEGKQVYLAALDGSVQTYINIDQLEFQQEGYNINVLGDSLTIKKHSNNMVKIYYQNLDDDNEEVELTITNLDNNAVVFSQDEFADNNEITVYFNYATINTSNTTIFKVSVETLSEDGSEDIILRYFGTQGGLGTLTAKFVAIISVLVLVFGMSFTSARLTFSWFGIMILLGGLIFTTFAVATWYITFIQVIYVICLIFCFIILTQKNYPTVS